MAEVKQLREAKPDIDEGLVKYAQGLLDGVMNGDIVAIATVEVMRGVGVKHGWCDPDPGYYHSLNSGAARLANHIAAAEFCEEHEDLIYR